MHHPRRLQPRRGRDCQRTPQANRRLLRRRQGRVPDRQPDAQGRPGVQRGQQWRQHHQRRERPVGENQSGRACTVGGKDEGCVYFCEYSPCSLVPDGERQWGPNDLRDWLADYVHRVMACAIRRTDLVSMRSICSIPPTQRRRIWGRNSWLASSRARREGSYGRETIRGLRGCFWVQLGGHSFLHDTR